MKNNEKSSLFTFFEKLKTNKIIRYVLIAFLVITLLLILTIKTEQSNSVLSDNLSYVNNLEIKLEKALSNVEGAGSVKVVITVESGMETVLAMKTVKTETVNGIEIEETPILINGKTVTLMEKYPKITGVLIVLESTNFAVIKRIQDATKSLLDINYSQIEILTMK